MRQCGVCQMRMRTIYECNQRRPTLHARLKNIETRQYKVERATRMLSNANRALCLLTLGSVWLVVVSAQGGRDEFIIRVSDLPTTFGAADFGSGVFRPSRFNFGDFALEQGDAASLPAVDVVVDDVNLLQRNNLIAAAAAAEPPAPAQRIKATMNSGLRRR